MTCVFAEYHVKTYGLLDDEKNPTHIMPKRFTNKTLLKGT